MRHPLVLLPVLLATLVGAPPALAWTWPTDGPVLQPFVLGDDPYAAGQHRGVDVAGVAGTPVRAPASGSVSFAGAVPGGGRTVTIQTADGHAVTLLHLGTLGVTRGVYVDEGATVGSLGASGDAEHPVPYVHLGVRVAADAQGYLDPLLFLPPRAPVGAGEGVAPAPGEVVAPAPEAEPAPPQGEGAAEPEADAGSRPGDAGGSPPEAPASPAGVEIPIEPGTQVEAPALAVIESPSAVGEVGRHATARGVGSGVEAPRIRVRTDAGAAQPGARAPQPPLHAEAALPGEPDGAKGSPRGGRPEPVEAASVPARVGAANTSDASVRTRMRGLAATAALVLLGAGALGLLRRRRTPALPLPAPEERREEHQATVDALLDLEALESRVLAGARRRERPPGGPKRRLERLGPHADRPSSAPLGDSRRERARPVDAW